ncbi:MAG: carboxypeptidase regulatory-like domain-containing protein, partial [Bryobacteraceae bacterium]
MGLTPFSRNIFLLVLATSIASAQGTGSIAGTVFDPSGAPVPLVIVTATQQERGAVRTAQTNAQGAYVLPLLPVGSWSVSVDAKAFKPFRRSGIELATEDALRVDINLEVGELTQSIVVTADAGMVDTRSSQIGTLIDNRRVLELPENGRNVISLAALVPGTASVSAPQTFTGDRSGDTLSVSGSRTTQNLFLFDGQAFNGEFRNTGFNYPPPDAVQEVKVLTNSFSAEYGRNSGAVFSVVTKSGSNLVHGALWEFLRNSALNAQSYFSTTKPTLIQNQFGAAAGGPIKKDKLFVFGSYEGLRLRESSLTSSQTPLTAAERAGDFAGGRIIKDPLTGVAFPGNMIPPGRFDPTANNILTRGIMPLPNTPSGLYVSNYPKPQNNDQVVSRMDYNWGAHTISGRYNYNHATQTGSPGSIPQYAPQNDNALTQSVTVGDTWVLRPTLLSEFRFSVNRFATTVANVNHTSLNSLGSNFPVLGPPAPAGISVSGRVAMGTSSDYDEFNVNANFQVDESLTWTKGNHIIKGGFELLHLRYVNRSSFLEYGAFSFDGSFTGNAAADFLLGKPVSAQVASPTLEQDGLQLNTYYFLQDDWRVNRRLTLNLGLRYEVPLPWVSPQNYWATLHPGQQSTVFPGAPTGLVYYGDKGVPRGMIPTDLNNLAPRIGFAWDPFGSGRTSVRGAFGVFYDAINANIIQNADQPFRYAFTIPAPYSFTDPLRGVHLPTSVNLTNPLFTGIQQIDYPDPGTRSPYVEEFNFNVQHQIVRDLSLEAAYVGKLGHKLPIGWNDNPGLYAPGATAA